MQVGLYARVSTHDQQTLTLQREAMEAYVQQRAWEIAVRVEEVGSGGRERWQREALMRAARRRDIDAIVVWRLDRWGRSLADLVGTLHELQALGLGFISLSEALDFATPTGAPWRGCWRSLRNLSGRSYASGSKRALPKPGSGAHPMDDRRRWRTTQRPCSSSLRQASVSQPSPGN
jgi:hypothetical protein